MYKQVDSIACKYDMTILPVPVVHCIENLYPPTNHVHKWNILIVGKDKTFIHASLPDLADFPDESSFPNNRSGTVLCRELQEFFDPIFDETLRNEQLQFYMTFRCKIYLCNTYPILNQLNQVIGAILFIRDNSLMPRMAFVNPVSAPQSDVEKQIRDHRMSGSSFENNMPQNPIRGTVDA
jgi:hypothetical protein